MEWIFQAAAGVMVAVVLWLLLSKYGKEYGLLLSIGACCLILLLMFRFLEPILALLKQLEALGGLQPQWLSTMLKAVGIGLIVEICSLICNDAGNGAMAKSLQILGTVAIVWLSIPLIKSLTELLQQILGEI